MSALFGFDLLRVIATERAAVGIDYAHCHAPGDSEIEKLFFVALEYVISSGDGRLYSSVRLAESPEQEEAARAKVLSYVDEIDLPDGSKLKLCDTTTMIVRPQVDIDGWRVDFLIHVLSQDPVTDEVSWKRLIVECDGHDFHERTKEQAARDRARDRSVTMNGYTIFRFTGSELWRDPIRCVDQVIDWGMK